MGVVWFPVFMVYCYETPEEHPAITSEELDLIHYGKDDSGVHTALLNKDGSDKALLESNVSPESNSEKGMDDAYQESDQLGLRRAKSKSGDYTETGDRRSSSFSVDNHTYNSNNNSIDHGANPIAPLRMSMQGNTLTSNTTEAGKKNETLMAIESTPWLHIFTNKYSVTLFIQAWAHVSDTYY